MGSEIDVPGHGQDRQSVRHVAEGFICLVIICGKQWKERVWAREPAMSPAHQRRWACRHGRKMLDRKRGHQYQDS